MTWAAAITIIVVTIILCLTGLCALALYLAHLNKQVPASPKLPAPRPDPEPTMIMPRWEEAP